LYQEKLGNLYQEKLGNLYQVFKNLKNVGDFYQKVGNCVLDASKTLQSMVKSQIAIQQIKEIYKQKVIVLSKDTREDNKR
jgi:GTP1/Obg family GTP-binding protein